MSKRRRDTIRLSHSSEEAIKKLFEIEQLLEQVANNKTPNQTGVVKQS